jgi:hypothetical protein
MAQHIGFHGTKGGKAMHFSLGDAFFSALSHFGCTSASYQTLHKYHVSSFAAPPYYDDEASKNLKPKLGSQIQFLTSYFEIRVALTDETPTATSNGMTLMA